MPKIKDEDLITVGELKSQLENWDDDMKLSIGCNSLSFYRFKKRGDNLLHMEFNQTIWDDDDEEGNIHIANK